MFALSTAWNSGRHRNARLMVEEIKGIGFDHIELDFNLKKHMVKEIAGLVSAGAIKVVSLHNFCPVPENVRAKKVSPDHYSLASIDGTERKKALLQTKETIDTASALKAEAVIIHSGRLNIRDRTRKLAKVMGEGGEVLPLLAQMQSERREELKKGYLESLLKSMEALSAHANKRGIKLGLENRFYFRELPSIDEFEVIFERFGPDSNIGYWHDMGHAQVFENLKIAGHREYLDRFSDRLIGVHIHDIKGIIDDHQAPLAGELDFSALKNYIKKGALKVLEPHYPATSGEIKRGLEYLKNLFDER